MSASEPQAFVEEMRTNSELVETIEEDGLFSAAEAFGFDLEFHEFEMVVEELAAEDLPNHEVDHDDHKAAITPTTTMNTNC